MKNTNLMTRVVFVFLLLGLVAFVLSNSFAKSETLVNVSAVQLNSISTHVSVSGNVINHDELSIGSLVSGRIVKLVASEGSLVHKGMVLAYLDDRENAINLNKYAASLLTAEQNQAVNQSDFEHIQEIFSVGGESKKAVDNARLRMETSQADVRRARDDMNLAQIQSEKFKIKAPVNGTVTACSARAGASVNPGEVLFKLSPSGTREIEIKMDAIDSDIVSVGKVVTASTDAYPGKEWQEKIIWVAPSAKKEGTSSNLSVRISMSTDAPPLILGQQVDIKIPQVSAKNVPVVPSGAIIYKQGSTLVATIIDGKVGMIPIEVGTSDLKFTEVKSGIAVGQQVILPEGKVLRDGQSVRNNSNLVAL
jgi:RND family efflux transporter MFP subunit